MKLWARLLLVGIFLSAPALAAPPPGLSESEYRALAAEISQKVDLFRETWKQDPAAEFSGGTSRDFLYWLKGQFTSGRDKSLVLSELRARAVVPAREFLAKESDVDIVTAKELNIQASDYGIRKIDKLSPEIFDAATPAGHNELYQGYLPAEKIRLGAKGLIDRPGFGDGAGEIYRGKLSAHFASPAEFASTKYAQEGLNHPTLLAMRYLRLQAMNYFREHGSGAADEAKLAAAMDPKSVEAVKAVIAAASKSGELKPYLERPSFRTWLNATIKKSFEAYTNPNAALALIKEFGADKLAATYGSAIDPFYGYVFHKTRDGAEIARNLRSLATLPEKIYEPPSQAFPDGFLYHGTKEEEAFRAILFYGAKHSEMGVGGKGLYGVNQANKAFAEDWGGDKKRLIRFAVEPGAKLVDVTKGEGKRVWDAYVARFGAENAYENFPDYVGADILRYPYGEQDAYVVKNGGAIGRAEGVYRKILPLLELEPELAKARTLQEFLDLAGMNSLSRQEVKKYFPGNKFGKDDFLSLFRGPGGKGFQVTPENLPYVSLMSAHEMAADPVLFPFFLEDPKTAPQVVDEILSAPDAYRTRRNLFWVALTQRNLAINNALLERVTKDTNWFEHPDLVARVLNESSPLHRHEFINRTLGLFAPANVRPMPPEVLSALLDGLSEDLTNLVGMDLTHPRNGQHLGVLTKMITEGKGTAGIALGLATPEAAPLDQLRILLAQHDPVRAMATLRYLNQPDPAFARALLEDPRVSDEAREFLRASPVWRGLKLAKAASLVPSGKASCGRLFQSIGNWWQGTRLYHSIKTGRVEY